MSLLEETIKRETASYIMMDSKFPGTCFECKVKFEAGTKIMWAKDVGAKHLICKISDDIKKNLLDTTGYVDMKAYTFNDVRLIKNCQRCGTSLSHTTDCCIQSDDIGNRRVCMRCFRY